MRSWRARSWELGNGRLGSCKLGDLETGRLRGWQSWQAVGFGGRFCPFSLFASVPATLPLRPIPGARNCSCTLGLGVQSVNRWSWLRLSNPHRACPARRRPMSSHEWNIHSRRPIIFTLRVVVPRVVAPKGGAHGVQGCPMQKASGTGPALSIRPRMGAEKRTTFPSSVLRRCRGSHSCCFHAYVGHEWMDPTSAELRGPPDVR